MMARVGIVNFNCFGNPELSENVASVDTLRPLNLPMKILRSLLRRLSTRTISWFEDYSGLAKLRNCDIIILADYYGEGHLARYIDKQIPGGGRKVIFFWNLIESEAQLRALPGGWEVWTFDRSDAVKYGVHYAGSFYFPSLYSRNENATEYDLFFLGLDKGRFKVLKQLQRRLGDDIDAKFVFVDPVKCYFSIRRAKPVSYGEYLEQASKAKAILEWNRTGQQGLTMRTFEALAMGKKLVTNNISIADYDFYNPANIFILSDENLDELKAFLKTPSQTQSEDLLQAYTFEAWLRRNQ